MLPHLPVCGYTAEFRGRKRAPCLSRLGPWIDTYCPGTATAKALLVLGICQASRQQGGDTQMLDVP